MDYNSINAFIVIIVFVILIGIIILCSFIIWLIKKGVKNAIEETLYSTEFREQLRNDITFSIIRANKQLNNSYEYECERPTD